MNEEDDVLNVVLSLLVRVWGKWYAYHTRMRQAIRVWVWLGNVPYAYGHEAYVYGQKFDFSELLLCSFGRFS
jgi:hypothetical protein